MHTTSGKRTWKLHDLAESSFKVQTQTSLFFNSLQTITKLNPYLFGIPCGQMKQRSISLVQMPFRTCGVALEKNAEKNVLYSQSNMVEQSDDMVWGYMSAHGVGELHFIDGIMNADMQT